MHMRTLYFKVIRNSLLELVDEGRDGIRMVGVITSKGVEILKGDEREILIGFTEILKEENPQRFVGFKQDYEDWPVLVSKSKAHGIDLKSALGAGMKITGKYFRGIILRRVLIPSRENIDLFAIAWRDFPRLPTKEIDEMADALGIEFRRIPQYRLARMSDGDVENYLRNYLDVLKKIAEEVVPFEEGISKISGIPMDEQIRLTVGEIIDHLVSEEMRKRGIDRIHMGGKRSYTGGYVWLKAPGVYEDVVYIDFQSMYPSIIKVWNISPETVDSVGEEVEVEGVKCRVRRDTRGVIPGLIDRFLSRRLKIKDEIKKNYDRKKDAEQRALKVLANAMYGYMGWEGARYYNIKAAEVIAALARHYIKEVKKKIEEMGGEVIYIDTDGIQFTGANAEEVVRRINGELPLNIEIERIVDRAVYYAKKKYAHLHNGKVDVTGLECVRKDYPPLVKRAQREILEALLGGDADRAREIRTKYRKEILQREAEVDDLAIVEQLTKKIDEYAKPTKASVAARIIKEKFGLEPHRGSNLYVVVVKGSGGPTHRARPVEIVKREDIDWAYYLKVYDDVIKRTFAPFGVPVERRWF